MTSSRFTSFPAAKALVILSEATWDSFNELIEFLKAQKSLFDLKNLFFGYCLIDLLHFECFEYFEPEKEKLH